MSGSFDLISFVPWFEGSVRPPRADGLTRAEVLEDVDTATLAHELTHIMHAFGSACGIRYMLMTSAEDRTRAALITRLIRGADNGILAAPILANYDPEQPEPGAEINSIRRKRTHLEHYLGAGRHVGTTVPDDMSGDMPSMTIELNPWPVPQVDMTYAGDIGNFVSLGLRQITEGCAKFTEENHRRAAEEEDGTYVHLEPTPAFETPLDHDAPENPYYVLHQYHNMLGYDYIEPLNGFGSKMYTWVLAELALMVDPVFTPLAFKRIFHDEIALWGYDTAIDSFTPALTFHRASSALWNQATQGTPLDDKKFTNTAIALIQNAILDSFSPGLTMQALVDECLEHVRLQRHMFGGVYSAFGDRTFSNFVGDSVIAALEFRRDNLYSAGFINYLNTEREGLLRAFDAWCPVFSVGDQTASSFSGRSPNERYNHTAASSLAEICENLMLKNSPCPLAATHERQGCTLPRVELCSRLPTELPPEGADPHCVRAYALEQFRPIGLRQIKWSESSRSGER